MWGGIARNFLPLLDPTVVVDSHVLLSISSFLLYAPKPIIISAASPSLDFRISFDAFPDMLPRALRKTMSMWALLVALKIVSSKPYVWGFFSPCYMVVILRTPYLALQFGMEEAEDLLVTFILIRHLPPSLFVKWNNPPKMSSAWWMVLIF